MSVLVRPIDYAPPRKRPAWLNPRNAVLALLVLAAMGAGWIVLPATWERHQFLNLQQSLLDFEPAEGDFIAGANGFCNVYEIDVYPQVRRYARDVLGVPMANAGFVGGRDAGSGERLVIIGADPIVRSRGGQPELRITAWVVEPGGWFQKPRVLCQTTLGPSLLPLPRGAVLVMAGERNSEEPARFYLNVRSLPSEAQLQIEGRLRADDSIHFEWSQAVAVSE